MADVMAVLHGLNTGIVRDLICDETTVTPVEMEKSKWIFLTCQFNHMGIRLESPGRC
jgi:uncharacterized membrane protein YeiH